MKRIWAYLLACLLLVCSCVNPLTDPGSDEDRGAYPEGAKVTINFTVAGEGLGPVTKGQALGEDQPLMNLYLAVFGSSGYLKEYVEATCLGETGTYEFTSPKDNPDDEDIKITVPLYSFSATLTLTDSKRIIHFIGNGPETISFGYVDAVLSSLLSLSGERAYWQMMRIDGIHAKQSTSAYIDDNDEPVEVGDYIDANGNKITNGEGYVVSEETQSLFETVPLVRNWAKIIVQADRNNGNDPYFEPISYAIVHVPDRGTLAPHSSATNGFIEDYQNKTFLDIVNLGYPANLPPNTAIDETIPALEDFTYWDDPSHNPETELVDGGWRNGVAPVHPKGAVYLYERPVPSDQLPPTFLLIYGKYLPEDHSDPHYGDKCFYKVDLMTDRKYYPIYRNFQYRVLIHSILSFGHPTPTAAAAAAGSADVSADINARHLPDISDGKRRLAIQPWMAKTFTNAQENNQDLHVYFDSDVALDGWDTTPGSVTVEALPMRNSAIDPVILSSSIEDTPDDNGFRTITFTTSGPSDNIRSQTLRVTGHSGEETIYRDIIITIQNIQEMRVSCSDRRIMSEKGTPVELYIDIPDGLAESMFPLEFKVEPEMMTLSPNHDNLPVEYGTSIIDGNDKQAFHFIKSLIWSEYQKLPAQLDASDKVWRRMVCHFISNRDISSTDIYVTNDEYFYPGNTHLGNYLDKSFHDLQFREPILQNTPGQELTLDFEVARGDDNELPTIELFVDGLIPLARTSLPLPEGFTQVSDVTYRFTPTTSHVTIPFVTSDADGEVYLRLEAEDYLSQSLSTHHFTLFNGIGFFDGHATRVNSGWSNVVFGKVNSDKDKNVLFGFFTDPDDPDPELSLLNLQSLTWQKNSVWKPITGVGDPYYREVEFRTNNTVLLMNASFTLSAPGYLQLPASASRFRGNIYTVDANFNKSNVPNHAYSKQMDNTIKHTCTVTFSENFRVENSGVWLDTDAGPGIITVTVDDSATTSECQMFFLQFKIGEGTYSGTKQQLFPNMDTAILPADEQFFKYPGDNKQAIWLRPDKAGTSAVDDPAQITIEPNADYPVQITGIVLKTFRYN